MVKPAAYRALFVLNALFPKTVASQLRRAAKRIAKSPAGAHMRAKTNLLDILADRDALRAMPEDDGPYDANPAVEGGC